MLKGLLGFACKIGQQQLSRAQRNAWVARVGQLFQSRHERLAILAVAPDEFVTQALGGLGASPAWIAGLE